jgi:very-short-patch-repair endonuclease
VCRGKGLGVRSYGFDPHVRRYDLPPNPLPAPPRTVVRPTPQPPSGPAKNGGVFDRKGESGSNSNGMWVFDDIREFEYNETMEKDGIISGQKISQEKQNRARELRRSMTLAERKLWNKLRANRLGGWHFRRQQIIDDFIVDFYCHKAGLIIEVDGPIHQKQPAEDAEHTKMMAARGLKVLRFNNSDVMNKMDMVLRTILDHLETSSPFLQERG